MCVKMITMSTQSIVSIGEIRRTCATQKTPIWNGCGDYVLGHASK